MKLFSLFGEVFIKDQPALQSLDRLDKKAAGTGKNLGSMGQKAIAMGKTMAAGAAVAVTAIAAVGAAASKIVNDFVQTSSALVDMSNKTGISIQQLQELKYVAGQTGVDFNTVTSATGRLIRTMSEARNGNKKAAEAFSQLGVSIYNAQGGLKSTNDILPETLRALSNVGNETERNALAMQIFGRGALELAPLMEQGADSVDALTQKFRELGLAIDDESIMAAEKLGDDMETLNAAVDVLWASVAAELVPAFQEFVDLAIDNLPEIKNIVKLVGYAVEDLVHLIRWFKGESFAEQATIDMENAAIDAAEKSTRAKITSVRENIQAEKERLSANLRNIKDYYQKEIDAAADREQALKRSKDNEIKAAQKAHDKKMEFIDEEYRAAIKGIDRETDAKLKAIQDQIDAVDDAEQEERIADLKKKISTTRNLTRRKEYIKELEELEREKTKDDLRDQLEAIRIEGDAAKEKATAEYETKKETENNKYNATIERLDKEKSALDNYKENYEKKIQEMEKKKIQSETNKANAAIKQMEREKKALEKNIADTTKKMQAANVQRTKDSQLADILYRQGLIARQMAENAGNPEMIKKLGNAMDDLKKQEKALRKSGAKGYDATKPTSSSSGGGGGGGFAMGTNYVPQSGSYLVGERGPEIVNLPQGAAVVPNHKIGQGINVTIQNPFILDDYGVNKLLDRMIGRLKLLGLNP